MAMLKKVDRFEHRSIFISHAHSDRTIVDALRALVKRAFSGLVEVFASSDPSPTGGLQPGGDTWFDQIHENLTNAEAVWVVATPESVKRPWIFWEAGIGRALCPSGVVVLRLQLSLKDLPSPLSHLQSYDGLSSGEDGMAVMLGKIGGQIGMTLDGALLDQCIQEWHKKVSDYKPLPSVQAEHTVTEEQLNRLEGVLARLENLPTTITTASEFSVPGQQGIPEQLRGRKRRTSARDPERLVLLEETFGRVDLNIRTSFADLVRNIEALKPGWTAIEVEGPDSDNDIVIRVKKGALYLHGWLTPEAALTDVDESTLSDQFSQVLSQARQLLRESGITARKTPVLG